MAPENTPDPLKLILDQLNAIKLSNETLQNALARQEARHQEQMAALLKDVEERLAALAQSASPPQLVSTNAEGESVPVNTPRFGTGSSPATPIPPVTQTPPTETRPKSERLPDPPAFSGKKKDLPLFLTKLRYKLKGNADRFPDEESRLIYAHSRLERDPATLVDPLMDKDITTVEQLVQFLEATYGDPNRELTAWSRLDNLKQGKKNFLSHFADFRRLVADTNLNEGAQINQLRRSLSDELRRAMVGVPIPRSINDYANLIALYDNDLRYLPTARTPIAPKQKYPVDMEIDTADSAYAPKGSNEREKRYKEGRCFKCNKKGHISSECSVPMPRQQVRAHEHAYSDRSSSSARSSRSRGRSSGKRSPAKKGKAPSRG